MNSPSKVSMRTLMMTIAILDRRDVIHVGHSTGGGEVARYIGRHGTSRVAKVVLIGSVTPLMLRTAGNRGGLPLEVFDGFRASVHADRSQYFKDLSGPFYGANRSGATVSQAVRDAFWLQGMQAGFKSVLDCIKAFSETDHTEDLKKIDVSTLILRTFWLLSRSRRNATPSTRGDAMFKNSRCPAIAVAVIALGLTVSFASHPLAGPGRNASVRNVVLVHGAWADGSSWSRVIPLLQARGFNVTDSTTQVRVVEETPGYWRVLFDHPPLNIVGTRLTLRSKEGVRYASSDSAVRKMSRRLCAHGDALPRPRQ
jgi:pimeloyl-ACP methyl ester carboxylesterase